MSSVFHRYEASVKLSNGRVVVYHNINTGLKKISSVFVRKINKEIVGKYKNSIPGKEQKAVTIFTKTMDNERKTGVFVPMIFERNNYELIRNMFVANKLIINRNSLLITIPEWIFETLVINGKKELYEYYLNENHQIMPDEITLSKKMYFTREKIITPSIPGTEPEQDYP